MCSIIYIYIYTYNIIHYIFIAADAVRKHNSTRKREYARIMLHIPRGGDSIMREYRRSRAPLRNPMWIYIYIYIYTYIHTHITYTYTHVYITYVYICMYRWMEGYVQPIILHRGIGMDLEHKGALRKNKQEIQN